MALAAEESTKSKAAKEVIKSLTAQVIFQFYTSVGTWLALCMRYFYSFPSFHFNKMNTQIETSTKSEFFAIIYNIYDNTNYKKNLD